ncbi:MAG: fluoride efflux transporter CrcB [Terriglobales bacterium]
MWKSVVVISLGASSGALLRWWFGAQLNALLPSIPMGTLAANLLGGYIIGAAVAIFASSSAIAPEWRLLIMTGFCGGLTTFSTFSVELATLVKQGEALWSCAIIMAHVGGSLLMTFAGMATIELARR